MRAAVCRLTQLAECKGPPESRRAHIPNAQGGGDGSRTCALAIQPWYDEVRDYRFTSRPWSDNGGRFRWVVALLAAMRHAHRRE